MKSRVTEGALKGGVAWRCDFLDGRSSAWARARLRRVPCGHRKATQRASVPASQGTADIGARWASLLARELQRWAYRRGTVTAGIARRALQAGCRSERCCSALQGSRWSQGLSRDRRRSRPPLTRPPGEVLGVQRSGEQHGDRGGGRRTDTDLRDEPIAGWDLDPLARHLSPQRDGRRGGLTQPYIKAGETAKYEWTLRQYGSFMFHSHHDEMTQMGMGLIGMFVVHPRHPSPEYRVDRDFSLMISEWSVKAGTFRPNTLEMTDFNVLTIMARCFPRPRRWLQDGRSGELRLGNLGAMDHHPMHIHGHHFRITATDGEDIPLSAQWPETTVLVAVGQTRNVEFIADAPGDWGFHCHMTHHVMNQMGHEFPNMVGMKPGDLDEKIRPLLPAYMTHGQTGMDMGKMAEIMPYPRNTIAMKARRDRSGIISRWAACSRSSRFAILAELRAGSRLVSASPGNSGGQGKRC